MNTLESLKCLEEITNTYLDELNVLSIEQLTRQPSENEWSIGQMYLHLIGSALFMQIRSIEECMTQADTFSTTEGKTEAGKAIFEQGGFPPIRIHVPASPQYTPQQPRDKEQITEGLNTVLRRMKEIEPRLDQSSLLNTAPHPRLGALNAREWFIFVEMHYRHHLLQKDRLKQYR
ncbi:DinB family protein [Paenibacillus sp. FA6]|uniref:DinB family protein n=1 Tax=Paenibacillus sp. FA6 TaxID=3413029 RepID=UPI003F65F93E